MPARLICALAAAGLLAAAPALAQRYQNKTYCFSVPLLQLGYQLISPDNSRIDFFYSADCAKKSNSYCDGVAAYAAYDLDDEPSYQQVMNDALSVPKEDGWNLVSSHEEDINGHKWISAEFRKNHYGAPLRAISYKMFVADTKPPVEYGIWAVFTKKHDHEMEENVQKLVNGFQYARPCR